ncbi:hypothetical protein FGO68_gene15296 [Halteria grandinella]|uniref:Secreted protein n=1 Tax=Halteria grandinella TaxID=5974 RepID=A0A8J8T719_HALGN|nr:hypothetical protein FGO68_gene15296 [Halteria grandinella]
MRQHSILFILFIMLRCQLSGLRDSPRVGSHHSRGQLHSPSEMEDAVWCCLGISSHLFLLQTTAVLCR